MTPNLVEAERQIIGKIEEIRALLAKWPEKMRQAWQASANKAGNGTRAV
jgi:hypothetical protein